MKYTIFELGARQYLIKPGQTIKVDKIVTSENKLIVEKVLLERDDDKIEIGTPYLKKSLDLEIIGDVKEPKIRVATYKAKANYRRVKGQRRQLTQIKLKDDTKTVKK